MSESPDYHPLYLEGIACFNVCEFFEAHDLWEELWTEYSGSSRDYFKGLIQAAVCLHHFGNGNVRGAKKLYASSRGYLQKYLPCHLGLELEPFLTQMTDCCSGILASTEEFPEVEMVPDRIPEIHLSPQPPGAGS